MRCIDISFNLLCKHKFVFPSTTLSLSVISVGRQDSQLPGCGEVRCQQPHDLLCNLPETENCCRAVFVQRRGSQPSYFTLQTLRVNVCVLALKEKELCQQIMTCVFASQSFLNPTSVKGIVHPEMKKVHLSDNF